MRITAIKAQLKNPGRVSLFVDGEYAFSLTPNQLLQEKLYTGQELDDTRLAQLQKASNFGKLWERVLAYALLRPRSVREVELYCGRKKADIQDCQAVIAKLSRLGYLDDLTFAVAWVESRRLIKATSQRKLQVELRQKGVNEAIIAEVLAAHQPHETEALARLIAKKRRLVRYRDDPQKLIAYLLRQGFVYDDIQQQLQSDDYH